MQNEELRKLLEPRINTKIICHRGHRELREKITMKNIKSIKKENRKKLNYGFTQKR